MLILGHTGITGQIGWRLSKSVSLSAVALTAFFPDIIDKSIHYLICPLVAPGWTNGSTRTIAHSLTFNAVVMAVMVGYWIIKKKQQPWFWVYAAIVPLHLLLDEMWDEKLRVVLCWPWLGNDFYQFEYGISAHLHRNFNNWHVIAGEIIGAALLMHLWKSVKRYRGCQATPPR